MAGFATVDDLIERWRPLGPTEAKRAGALIKDASALIVSQMRQAGRDITDPDLADALKAVTVAVVKRAMIADDGVAATQVSQTAGPYTQAFTYQNPAGDLYLTRTEKGMLGLNRQVFGSIPPVIGWGST